MDWSTDKLFKVSLETYSQRFDEMPIRKRFPLNTRHCFASGIFPEPEGHVGLAYSLRFDYLPKAHTCTRLIFQFSSVCRLHD